MKRNAAQISTPPRSARASELERDAAIPENKTSPNSPLLDTAAAAVYLNAGKQTLVGWRSTKRYALPYVKIGRRVQYRVVDLDAFIKARTIKQEE
jgi:hypothetical protein